MLEPSPCDLLITDGTVLDLDGADGRIHAAVAVADGIVVAVDPAPDVTARWAPQRHIDADGAYVAPGFVDGHVHLSAVLGSAQPYTPASGPSLFGGGGSSADIGRALHQFLLMPVPADIVEAAVAPVLAALAAGGTTAVVDAGSAGIDGIVAAARRVGVRVAVGPSVHDVLLGDAGEVVPVADAEGVLGAAEDWLTRQQSAPGDPFEPVLTVTEPTFCSDGLLAGLAGLIDRTGVAVSFHSHETSESVADHDHAHGRAAIDRLAECGLLGPRCTLMHAGSVSDRDIEMIAATRTCVNVNPLGNGMLGFGAAAERAIARYLDAGVRLVLGSDYTPSMIATGFDLVRAALMLTREAGATDDALTLEQALRMAANGTVAAGAAADLIVVDRTGPHHFGVDHPVPGLALRARPSDVRTVIVGGRVIVDAGALVTVNAGELCSAAGAVLKMVRSHS